ncbi:MAG: hypothetical protein H0W89_07560 [Candidatus Levybacteria bacterium]|nr:hypothetical protein [Candidatus Levybacteria bacterium]
MARAEGGSFGGRGGGPSAGSSRGGVSIGGSRGGVSVAERSGPSVASRIDSGFSSRGLAAFGKSESRPSLALGKSEKPTLSFNNSPYKSEQSALAKGPGPAFHTVERVSLSKGVTEIPKTGNIALKSVLSQESAQDRPFSLNNLQPFRPEAATVTPKGLVSVQNLDRAVPWAVGPDVTPKNPSEKVNLVKAPKVDLTKAEKVNLIKEYKVNLRKVAKADRTPAPKVDLLKKLHTPSVVEATNVSLVKAPKVDLIKKETPTVSTIEVPKVNLTKAPVQTEVGPAVSLIKEAIVQPIQSQQEAKPQALQASVTKSILEKVKSIRMPILNLPEMPKIDSLRIPQVGVREAVKVVSDKAKKIDLTRVLRIQKSDLAKRELPSTPAIEGPKVNLVKTVVAPAKVEAGPVVTLKKEAVGLVQPVQESMSEVRAIPSVIVEPKIATVTISETKPVVSVRTSPKVGSEVLQSISQTTPTVVAKEGATITTQPVTPAATKEGIKPVEPTSIRTETTVVTKKIVPAVVRENASAGVMPNQQMEVKAPAMPDTTPIIKSERAQVERVSVNANALSEFAFLRAELDDDEKTKAKKLEAENRMILQTARGYVRAGLISTVADAIRFTEQKLRIDPTILAKGPALAEKVSIVPLQREVPAPVTKQPTEVIMQPQGVPLTELVSEVSEQSVITAETVIFASPQSITKPKVDVQSAAPVNNEKASNVQPETQDETHDKKDQEVKFKIDEPIQKNRMAEWDAAIGQTFPAFQWDAQAPLSEIAQKLKTPGKPTNSTLIYQVGKKVDGSNQSIEDWRTPLLLSDVLVTAAQARRAAEDEISNKPAVVIKSNGIDADKKHVALVLSGDNTRENYDLAA